MTAKLFENEAGRIHETMRVHGIDALHWQVMTKMDGNLIQFVMFVCPSIKFNCGLNADKHLI